MLDLTLTSNYNRKEWSTFSLKLIVALGLPTCGIVFILLTLFLPMVEVMIPTINILVEDSLIVDIRDQNLEAGHNLSAILLYYVFTVAGGIVIPTFILLWSMGRLLALGEWFSNRMKLKDLILYWHGKDIRETKYGRLFK